MKETGTMGARRNVRRRTMMASLVLVMAMVASSCLYYPAAQRHIAASGGADLPWWCDPGMTTQECLDRSLEIDLARAFAYQYPTLADFTATGATPLGWEEVQAGVGVPYGEFDDTITPGQPNVLLYENDGPDARLVGVAYALEVGEVRNLLPNWIIRGYENHPNAAAASHPCLMPDVSLTSTADACFLASHTEPLQVLVTNDDGVGAPGIDAMVEALLGVSGVDIEIVAPAENQSGSGDNYTPGGTTSAPATTASGRAATAVDGTPADSVLHAIYALGLTPDLVMSGINEGQNLTSIGDLFSGTVGAARTGARSYVPAVASSQGTVAGLEPDFDSGADAALAWLERFRLGTAGPPFMTVANINIPTCAPGSSIRGTVETVVAPSIGPGQSYFTQDCTSTETEINDDLDAFNHGFIGIADMGLGL